MSPFWLYPKRRHAKTATCTVLVVAVLVVAVLDVSPFWMCRRFGCVAVLVVAVLDVSPFWRVAVLDLSPFWICRRFDLYPILHGLAPDYLNCAIARNAPTRALRSASDATLLAVTV